MKNIKSIITLKPVYGLHKDAVLTRNSNEENFVYETRYAGSDHTHNSRIELSASLIDKEHFSAIEWFSEKPMTNREKIAALESENKALKEQLDALKLAKSETSLAEAINKKIDEFQADFDKVATYSDKYYFSGNGAWVDEALTVYKNVIDVLKGLKA